MLTSFFGIVLPEVSFFCRLAWGSSVAVLLLFFVGGELGSEGVAVEVPGVWWSWLKVPNGKSTSASLG